MKFTDGYWHVREGYMIYNPADIRDIKNENDSVTFWAACKTIISRGDTLNLPLITMRFSSPRMDIICVKIYHHKGGKRALPEFQLNTDPDSNVTITEDEGSVMLVSGDTSVRIDKSGGWRAVFGYKGRYLTYTGSKTVGYITDKDKNAYIREQLGLEPGEYIYGLGERFTPFVKNGQNVDIWNEDGGTCSEQAYKNIPFYISNRGYGVFVNSPGRVSYEIASENVSRAQFSVEGECLEYYVIGGADMKEVISNYTLLTGRPALPPAWSFGLWLTTSFTTSYDEATVNSFIRGMLDRDIPLSVFHFDCFWMKEFQWCDFMWDRDVFPEPENMLKRLKSRGLRICVWINPYIAQKSYLFDEGMDRGYLLKKQDGGVWQWDRWQAGMALVDFTNPAAVKWYKRKLEELLDMGVDCFKTDFGERIPTDVDYYDGSDPERMHNYYTYLYNKAVFELLEEKRGRNEAAVFARSATAGSQKYPVHWGGDCSAAFASMAETLRGGLSLGLCGFGFWSHDISGFESTATPDIYKRWTAFGLLSSHSRLHGSSTYRVPWLFDEEAVDVLRFFVKLKCSLMPYLFAEACEASNKGIPMLRPMVLEFMRDPACGCLDMQYMLGGSLLAAPVFNEKGIVSYYLPAGRWTNYLTGETAEGPGWREERHGYMSLPLMARPCSIIAAGEVNSRPDYDYGDGVVLNVFELESGCSAETRVFNPGGVLRAEVRAVRNGNRIVININGSLKRWSVCLRGTHCGVSAGDARIENGLLGTRVIPNESCAELTIEML